MLNKPIDFAQLSSSRSKANHKTNLTKNNHAAILNAPRNIEGGRENPLPKGDSNSPQLKAVFLCLPFFTKLNFQLSYSIMTALSRQPFWLVVPLGGILTLFDAVTNTVRSICDGFTLQTKGIRYEN